MKRAVVDASVAIKWYVAEEESLAAAQLLDVLEELLVPDLIFPEIGNILWKKIRRGQLPSDKAVAILKLVEQLPMQIHESRTLIDEAFRIAIEFGVTVYDALYLAVATVEDAAFVTADRKLLRLAKGRLATLIVPLERAPEL